MLWHITQRANLDSPLDTTSQPSPFRIVGAISHFVPTRDRGFKSISLQRRVGFTRRANFVAPRSIRSFTPMGPIRDGPRGAENFKNRLEKRAESPAETERRGSTKERPGWGGLQATVVVISPPDVSLTGSVYD